MLEKPLESYRNRSVPEVPAETHLACILLLDTSPSMKGAKLKALNEGVNQFIRQTSMDEFARKRVDVAIVEFYGDARVVQGFTPLSRMEPGYLDVGGQGTSMGKAIVKAIKMAKERNHLYESMGTPHFQPWIVMITDGEPTDDISKAAAMIKSEESKGEHGKLKFWSVGVPGYSLKALKQLSDSKRIIELTDYNFTGFFNWLSESVVTVSNSRVGTSVPLPNLPNNARAIR